MAVIKSPFQAQYGFKSPGFDVDDAGNVTVRTITYSIIDEVVDTAGDFLLRQAGTGFTIDGVTDPDDLPNLLSNPPIELIRGSSYTFNLFLRELNDAGDLVGNTTFNIYSYDGSVYQTFNTGVTHVSKDGTTKLSGDDAQSKFQGKVTFAVPDNAPSAMWYGDGDQIPLVAITVVDPLVSGIGNFSRITTTGNLTAQGENAVITLSPSGSSGTVVINPANGGTINNMDITSNLLTVTETATFTGVNANVIISPTGNGLLTIAPSGGGTIDGITIGASNPSAITTNKLTATAGTINNIAIGVVTPSVATFTSAQVQSMPSSGFTVANKKYVDSRASAMAVAFGM